MSARGRVLVIEDDEPLRELVATVLCDAGYQVTATRAVREAVGVLREWRPDLVVMDLRMPDADGWAAGAPQRRSVFADVPLLILTAASDVERRARAVATPVLAKPFAIDDLVGTVQALLNHAVASRPAAASDFTPHPSHRL
jgi:two-component system OmpR family response regulator